MKPQQVENTIKNLQKQYPQKNIVCNKNIEGEITEIVCETKPNKEESTAIAVIDKTPRHYHKCSTEVYKILKGKLKLTLFNQNSNESPTCKYLGEGESHTIFPNTIHQADSIAENALTWIEVTTKPAWKPDDHILVS